MYDLIYTEIPLYLGITIRVGLVTLLIGLAAAWMCQDGLKKRVDIILQTLAVAFILMWVWPMLALMMPAVLIGVPCLMLSKWANDR